MHVGAKATEKYRFRRRGEAMLYLAAICDPFRRDDGGEEQRFCIMTTEPNASIAPYHNRMPVLLRRNELAAWVHDEGAAKEILRRKQDALEAEPMEPLQATLF
jgi:putative SOS response-associated peptidase YedK